MLTFPGPVMRSVLLALLTCLSLGCGARREGVDRSSYRTVFDAAMAAVAARDLDALWPLLTEGGRERVERYLRVWQRSLLDPDQAPRILAAIRERRADITKEEIELAARGTLVDAWQFFLEVDPREAQPKMAGLKVDPGGKRVTILYHDPYGIQRPVTLVQRPSGWYVDDLQL